MIIVENAFNEMFNSVAREFRGRVELLSGSTLLNIFTYDGALQSFTVERTGANDRFFGYGICQKATVKLRDKERRINVEKNQGIQIAYGVGNDYVYTNPIFYIDEVTRDENTNDLTITAYDAIYKASSHTVEELELPKPYTLETFIHACAALLGMPVDFKNVDGILLNYQYDDNVNFSETTTIREALDDAAEMLGAIYFLNNDWELTFKVLDVNGDPVLAIDKSKYFTLAVKTAHTLQNITSITELGDNVSAASGTEGETEYLRDNAFLVLRPDIGSTLNAILAMVSGLTIYQFTCKHRGNFLLEIGDKIALTTKDDAIIETYALNDSITYNGGLVGELTWEYTAGEGAEATPSTINDALKQTFAKVNKVTNEISLLTSQTNELGQEIARIDMTTDSITQEVSRFENATNDTVQSLAGKVQQTMTADDVSILIDKSMEDGVSSVTTSTGYVFDADGLTISKSTSSISTGITENGMTIYEAGSEILKANNVGVYATNLHANTYLIIGG